jgi:hypothetical protein
MVIRLIRRSLRPTLAAAVSACAALAGCGSEDPPSVLTQTRDSAGVTIVESTALPERGAGGWTLNQAPFLTIGTFEGDTLYQLYQVSGAVRLPDGRIAISDNGSFQLRIFGPDGTFQGSWGREGEGPGEFQAIRVMGVLGPDTLVVLDGSLRRISLFLPEEGLVGQSTVEEEVGMTFVANGMFQDGSIVFGGGLSFGPGGEIPSDGLSRAGTSYRSASLDGSLAADFGTVPGPEVFIRTQGGGGEYMISASTIPFARRPAASVRGDRFYVGSSDTYEIAGFDATGGLDRIYRVSQPPSPVTRSEVDRLIQERVTSLDDPSQAPALRNALGDMPTPPTMPAYQSLLVDAEGCLWVEDFQRPGVGLKSWTVFDAEGRPRTRLSLPASNRVLEIGSDYVMAIFEDALEVEYLRLYGLTRGG